MPDTTFDLPDGRTLTVIAGEPIEVTDMGDRPDPQWSHVDSHGHEHRYVDGHLPTLRWVVDEPDYVLIEGEDAEEYPGSGHYECTTCGDHVTPGMRPASGWKEFIPGTVRFELDGEEISREQAVALIETAGP